MDATETQTVVITNRWPVLATIAVTPEGDTTREFVMAGPFDCRECYEQGRGLVDHRDGSPCVAPSGGFGAF